MKTNNFIIAVLLLIFTALISIISNMFYKEYFSTSNPVAAILKTHTKNRALS